MPKTAPRKDGPQAVEKYTYPQGVVENGSEVVSRHGQFTEAILGPNASHVFETTDGKGVLPVEDQPNTISIRMAGIIQPNQGVTLYFRRRHGSTGAYVGYYAALDGPPQPRRTFTRAQ